MCVSTMSIISDFLFWVKGKIKFHPVRLLVCMFPAGRQITKRADGETSEVLKMLEERRQNDRDQPLGGGSCSLSVECSSCVIASVGVCSFCTK